jgi:hypothetical protein
MATGLIMSYGAVWRINCNAAPHYHKNGMLCMSSDMPTLRSVHDVSRQPCPIMDEKPQLVSAGTSFHASAKH